MKKIKKSFLFFCVIFAYLFGANTLNSQNKIDSSRYCYDLIISPTSNSDLLTGYKYYNNLKNKNLNKKDTVSAISNLRMIAISQRKMGLIHESERSLLEAIYLLDNLKSDTLRGSRYGLLNHLGIVYKTVNDYHKAIEVYNDALKITTKQKDSITIINNIALSHFYLEEYGLATDQFNLIYNKTINNSDPLQKARVLNNLGALQSKLNLPVALKNLNESLEIRKREKDVIGTYSTYKNLFHFYNDRDDKNKAQKYADSAYETVREINSKSYIQDALSLHIELNKDPKIIEYKSLTDSIHKAEQISRNEYSFNKYRYDKQEKIAKQNELQKEKEKRLKLFYQAIAVLVFLILISSYFIFKAKNKKEKLEEVYKTETRISKKVHDEVANEMYHVMTKLQNKSSSTNEVLDDIEEIYNKTRDISKENAAIEIGEGFSKMLMDLLVSYKNDEISIIKKGFTKINWNKKSNLQKTTIYRVLQELMTNMRKHSSATLVVLGFKQENNKLTIEYTDNGVGCDLKKLIGLKNTETRMKSINGSINFESRINEGFKAKISI